MKLKKILLHMAVVSGMFIFCFFIKYYANLISISGESMIPTYQDGDIVKYQDCDLNTKISYDDVVLFRESGNGKTVIKRVVGLPGDVLYIKNGQLYVNDKIYNGCSFGMIKDAGILNNYTLSLSENEYFCMGDNYENSRDSRSFGPVNKDWIFGIIFQ